MPTDDLFKLASPNSREGKITSECPIVAAYRRHQRHRDVYVAIGTRRTLGAAAEEPKLRDRIGSLSPCNQFIAPQLWKINVGQSRTNLGLWFRHD